MADEPTLGEVMRQVKSLVEQVRDLVKEVRSDYLRKDLYESNHVNLKRRVDQLEREADSREEKRQAFQKQIVAGVIVGVIVMLAQTAMTLLLLFGGIR